MDAEDNFNSASERSEDLDINLQQFIEDEYVEAPPIVVQRD